MDLLANVVVGDEVENEEWQDLKPLLKHPSKKWARDSASPAIAVCPVGASKSCVDHQYARPPQVAKPKLPREDDKTEYYPSSGQPYNSQCYFNGIRNQCSGERINDFWYHNFQHSVPFKFAFNSREHSVASEWNGAALGEPTYSFYPGFPSAWQSVSEVSCEASEFRFPDACVRLGSSFKAVNPNDPDARRSIDLLVERSKQHYAATRRPPSSPAVAPSPISNFTFSTQAQVIGYT